MWRAYGGITGVALVLNNSPFLTPSDALKAYTSPVEYDDGEMLEQELDRIADNLLTEAKLVELQGWEAIKGWVFRMLWSAAVSRKHPGFREEKEWRVVYSPNLERSGHLIEEIREIRGVPQKIYKIPLKNIPDQGLFGIEIPDLLDRIIIGPTPYGFTIREAFINLLAQAGVKEPDRKVVLSNIPLR